MMTITMMKTMILKNMNAQTKLMKTTSNNQKTGMLLQHRPHHLHQLYKERTLM